MQAAALAATHPAALRLMARATTGDMK